MNWLYYLGEANLYLCVFYLCYCLFLNKETHYTLNRSYLLFSCVAAFILPLLQAGVLKPVETIVPVKIAAPIVMTTLQDNAAYYPAPVQTAPITEVSHFTIQDSLLYLYILGAIVLMVLLAIKLYKLLKLRNARSFTVKNGYRIIYIEESNTAFSFFNYLFIGTNISGAETVIKHELVHINQKHSIDIILLELFKIVNWFNPMIYLLQNSLKNVHEYIADEQTAANGSDAIAYSSFLVDNAYGVSGLSITHSFFNYNLLKKRIIMLNQQRSGSLARLKYLAILPLCLGLLCVSTLSFSKTYGWDIAPQKKRAPAISAKQVPHPEAPPTQKVGVIKPPTPIVIKNGYKKFYTYLDRTIKYPVNHMKNDDAALVMVKFTIGSDHKVSNPIIAKSGGADFDKAALRGFNYTKTIADAPGEHSFLISFVSTNNEVKVDPALYKEPAYAGKLEIVGRYPPPIVKPDVAVPPKPKVSQLKFPPPVVRPDTTPIMPQSFFNYIGKSIHYPAAAREKGITGIVNVGFTIDKDHHITDVHIVKGVEDGMDKEVIRSLSAYQDAFSTNSGKYVIDVRFALNSYTEKDEPKSVKHAWNYGGMVVVVGYNIAPKVGMVNPATQKQEIGQVNATPNKTSGVILTSADGANMDFKIDKLTMHGNASGNIDVQKLTASGKKMPVIMINDERYSFKEPLKEGQHVYFTATDSVINYKNGTPYIKTKWGVNNEDVLALYGKASVMVK